MTQRNFAAVLAGVCGLAMALGSETAQAQNALGDGRALDRNLQSGSAGVNTRVRDIDAQIRFSNAVVTGNAPGGSSFRGNVGYLAPGEFGARLGSNDLFNVLRDTAPLPYGVQAGIRGTDALRYQFGLATGAGLPGGVGAPATYLRSGAGVTVSEVTSGMRSTADFLTSRSNSPVVIGGWRTRDGGDVSVTASPLLGIRQADVPTIDANLPSPREFATTPGLIGTTSLNQNLGVPTDPRGARPQDAGSELMTPPGYGATDAIGIDPLTGAETLQQRRAQDPTLAGSPTEQAREAHRARASWAFTGLEPVARGVRRPGHGASPVDLAAQPRQLDVQTRAHLDVVNRLRQEFDLRGQQEQPADPALALRSADTGPDLRTDLERRLDELRDRLTGMRDGDRTAAAPSPDEEQPPAAQRPLPGGDLPDPTALPGEQPMTPEAREAREAQRREAMRQAGIFDPRRAGLDERTVDALRRSRVTVRDLQSPSVADNLVYAENMAAGQALLAEGRYFDAEERFVRAAAAIPNEAMASVGRIHAQIGAGLYMSASMNLRTLLTSHPELVPVHYAPNLLPAPDRWATIRDQLRGRVVGADPSAGRAAAMLLAYLGYQFGDAAATREGLEALGNTPEMQLPSEAALVTLLSSVWLDEPLGSGSEPAPPLPAPQPQP